MFSIVVRLNRKQMCFLRKRTTKNIDRIENESDELKNLFDEKIASAAVSVRRVVRLVCIVLAGPHEH
jgi:hypothetical protein